MKRFITAVITTASIFGISSADASQSVSSQVEMNPLNKVFECTQTSVPASKWQKLTIFVDAAAAIDAEDGSANAVLLVSDGKGSDVTEEIVLLAKFSGTLMPIAPPDATITAKLTFQIYDESGTIEIKYNLTDWLIQATANGLEKEPTTYQCSLVM